MILRLLRPPLRLLPLLALLGLAACASAPRPAESGPVRTPKNVRGPVSWPEEVRRVAVLPAHDSTHRLPAEFVATYDAGWGRALAATQRAEFVTVSRATLAAWTGRGSLDSTAVLPAGLLARVAAETGADAVLFLDLTEVSPYPPLSLALRARLATPADDATLWIVDEIFDSRDAPTARGARIDARARASGVGDPASAIERSPSRFADHAFHAVAGLLPPRVAPATNAEDALRAKQFPLRADRTNRQSNGVPSSP